MQLNHQDLNLTKTISTNFKELIQFLKSTSFSKAIIVGIALSLPIIIGVQFGFMEIAIALSFGAFWSSPSDVSGSFRHKTYGILYSIVLIVIVSFIGGYLDFDTWFLVPVLGVLTFAISYIAVFGFRASLISFSGLLALVLSFAHEAERLETYEYAFFVGVGGLWYLLLATMWHKINPKGQTEELLAQTYQQTADFLEIRGKLIGPNSDREQLQAKLLALQGEINDNHETLREILISSRKSSGRSAYNNKRLLVFVQLVDMLEMGLANPVNYSKMDVLLSNHPEFVQSFQNLLFEMSRQLLLISEAGQNVRKIPRNVTLINCFKKLKKRVAPKDRYRLSISRSSKNISAQIIDDINKVTLLSASSVEKDIKAINKKNKSELSKIVALKLAKKAQEKKITKIYFDRGLYKYHGRVKIFAETLRKNGMEF